MPKKIYINKSNHDEDDEKKKSSGGYASKYVARRNNTPSNVSSGGYASRYVASKTSTRDYSQRQNTPDVRDAWAHQQANNGLFGSAYAAARREAAERAERERENRYYSSVIPGYNVLNEQGQAEAREKLTVDRPSSLNMTRAAFAKASQENQEKKAYDGMNGLQRTGEAAKSILKGVEKQYFGNQWSGISNAVDAVAGAMNGGATKSRENQVSAWAPYREAVKSASWDYVNQLLNGQQDAVENSGKALDRAVNNDWYLADAYDDKYGTNTARPKVREQLKSIADRIAAGDTSITADNILDYLEFGSLEDQVNEVFDRDDAIYSQFNDIIQSGQRDIEYAKAVGPIQGKFGDLTVDALAAALSSLQSSIMNRFSLGGVMASMAGDATGAVVGKLADKFGNTSALAKGAGFVGNRITDILGMSEFGVQSYGASTNEARQKMLSQGLEIGEKEFDQIQKYGAAKTAVELGTEMLFSSVGAIRNASGKGSVSEMFDAPGIGERLGDAISKLSKTERGAQILGLIGEKLGGGVEEGLEEVIGRLVDDVFDIGGIIGEDEQKSTFREYLTDFAVGMMSGLAGDAMRFVVDNVSGANEDNSDYAGNANRLRDFLNSDMSERAMDEAYADSIGRQMEAGTYDVENDPIWRAAYDRLETEQQIRREGIVSDADRRAQELLGAADFTQNDGSVTLESTQNRGEENGREAYYDNGTERYDSYDSGVETQRMAEEPGFADRGASTETAQQFRGAEQAPAQRLPARTGQVKSTELLGTKVGVADNTVTIIDTKAENTPAVVRRIEKLSSYLGRDIGTTHYYSGTLYRKGFNDELYEVHGFVDQSTGDVYIGVDDPQRAEKTFRHEVTHLLVAANKISVRKVMDYMKSMDPKAYSDIMTVYASAYAGSGMSLEGIWGEAVADAMAGINIEAREGSMFWNALEEYMPMVRHAVEDIHTITGDVFTEAYHTETDTSQNGTNAPPIYKDILASLGKNAKAQYTKNGELVIAENADQSTVLYSNRTLSKTQSALAKILFEKGYSDADVKRALNIVSDQAAMLNDIFRETEYSYLGDALDADVHTDIRGRQVLRAIVKNGEYPVNIDFLTICKKRQAYSSLLSKLLNEGIFDQIQFDADAIAMVNEELRNAGFETACLMCFVESRRQQIQKWATTFRDDWNAAVDKALDGKKAGDWNFYKGKRGEYRLTNNEALALSDQFEKASAKLGKNDKENLKLGQGSVPVKMATLLKNMPSLAKHLSTADLLTPEGFENLSRVSPELRSLLLQHYGSNTPKPVQEFTPYNGEIGDLSGNFMAKVVGESIPGLGQLQDAAKKRISAEAMAAFEEQAKLALSRKADALLDQIEEKRDTDDVDELWKEYKKVNPTKANIKREVNNLVNQWSAEEAIQKYLFDIGGVRLQSFSDYLVENTLDYYQLFADLAAKEFPLHAYTKEITFARLFGMTGAKINLSLIARLNLQSENAGLNPDGTYAGWSDYYNHAVLHPDEYIQSVGYKDAVALMMDPRYSSNVGTIAIGVSPAQIRKMLSDPYIRMVIPYHASGMNPTFAQLMHIDRYRDSTQYQNTSYGQIYDLDGNPVDTLTVGSKEMSGAQLRGTIEKFLWDETLQRVGDPKKAADEYLAWCARRHDIVVDGKAIGQGVYKPMFSGDYAHAENDFTNEENYYKLLENFTTKDAITEENAPQKAVQMLYPNQENILSGKDLSDYEARLREAKTDTGEKLFSEKDIAKYVKWAQQSSEDIIRAEVKSRKEYHDVQDAKLESETYPKIKARLQSGDYRFSAEGQQLTNEEQEKVFDGIDVSEYNSFTDSQKAYVKAINQWNGKDNGGYFSLGDTTTVLESVGIPKGKVYFDESKAASSIRDHREVTPLVLKQIPAVLNNPIVITESYDNTALLFGNLHDDDGRPIVVAIRAKSTARGNSIEIVNKVRSIGVRTHNLDKLLSEDGIVYLSENKEKTEEWFQALGRSTPFGGSMFGPIRKLSFSDDYVKSSDAGTIDIEETDGYSNELLFSQTVVDPDLIDRLEREPTVKAYRAMQLRDGKLYSPMAAKVNGQWTKPIELGQWEQTTEAPDLVYIKRGKQYFLAKDHPEIELKKNESYYFKLDKGNGTSIYARYNPYIHASRIMLNDQFTSAHKRPELVTVEVEVPASEAAGGYKAQFAKDAVGEVEWKSGPVAGKLSEGNRRRVILTRYDKPIRIVPNSEVARSIADLLSGEKAITLPRKSFTPELYEELEKAGANVERLIKTSSEVDSNNRQLSEAQQEYFKNSKIRDSKGRLLPMYHGTDASFTVFNFDRGGEHGNAEGFGIYLTNDKATAESYGGRIIESYADITRPARSDKKTITFSEMKKLVKAASIYDAQRMMETDDGYTLSDALKDSWISNYTYTYDKSMDAAYAEVARDILRMNDNDMDIVQEVIAGMGIRNYAAALPFYDLLTETTGIDGFVTNWKHTDGSPSSMIALAFRSEQIKNIDNLNPTSNPDIRYSTEGRGLSDEEQARAIMEGTGSTEEIRSLVYDIKDAVATPKMQKPFDWAEHEAARLSKRLIDQYKKYLKSENVKTARGTVKINDLAPDLQQYVGWMQKQLTDKNNQDKLQTRQGQEEFAKEAKDRASVIASKLINAKTVLTETEQAKADTIAEAKRVLKARVNIDEAYYKKLQNQFGTEFFPDEEDAKAMFDNVRDAVITLSPIYENPYQYYGWDMVEAVDRVAQDIVTQSMSDMASKAVPDALGNEIRNQAEEVRRAAEQTVSSAKAAARMRRDKMIRDIQRHAQETQQARRDMREASEERNRLLKIARRLNNKKLPMVTRERLNELIGDLDLVAQKLTKTTRMNLVDLKLWYDDQVANNPDFIADPRIQQKLDRLSKRQIGTAIDASKAEREGTPGLIGMTQEEVRDLTEALLNIENEIAWGKKLIDEQDKREVYYIGKEIIDHVENAVGLHGYFKQRLHRAMVQGALEPYAMIHRVTGYNENDGLYRAEQKLEEGQRIGLDFTRRAYEIFDQAIADEKFMRKFYGQHADEIEISGLNAAGETVKVKITPDQRAALYMHSLNDQNLRHIMNGGLTVPNIKAYKAGRMDYAFDNSTLIRLTPSMVREITSHMTEGERRFCRMAREYYDEMSQKEINAVSLKLKGYELAKVEHYFPINTDRKFSKASYENLTQDGTIEGMGFLKERVEASNAIYLRGIVDVTKQSIRMTAKYVGLAIPVRNFSKLLSVNTGVYETQETYNGEKTVRHPDGSVMNAIAHTWGDGALKYIDKMMTDIQNPRHDEGPLVAELRKMRGLYAGGVLNMNLGVAVKQAASYPTAAAVLGWKPLFDAFRRSKSDRVDLDLVAKYTPLLWYRSRGFSSMELGDLAANEGFKLPKALNWIQAVDVMTTKKLWRASEAYVRDNYKDLEIRSDAYYKAVADVYNQVIEKTQPNYTTMQRPEFLRSSFFVTSLFMFKTQPFQNFNIAYDAIGNLAAKQRMAKARGFDQQGMKDLKAARTQFRNGVTSLFVAAAVFSSMAGLWAAGRKRYGDDDPDMWWQDLISNFVSALIGGIPGATPIWEALSANVIFDDRYYGYETVTEGQFNDLLTNFSNVVKDLGDGKGITKKRAKQIAQTVGPFLGIPASNLINVWNAISAWTEGAIPEF